MKIKTLKTKKEFDLTFKKGKSFANKTLILYYKKNNLPENRYGIIITKKIGKAVKRNYFRRIIKENLKTLSMTKGYDILIIVRKQDHEVLYNEMRKSMIHIFKKNKLLQR